MPTVAPITVCCPTCWKWSDLGKAMTCKRCGTPLLLTDGRRVDEVPDPTVAAAAVAAPPEPPPLDLPPEGWSIRSR